MPILEIILQKFKEPKSQLPSELTGKIPAISNLTQQSYFQTGQGSNRIKIQTRTSHKINSNFHLLSWPTKKTSLLQKSLQKKGDDFLFSFIEFLFSFIEFYKFS
jgi:hypothetical protein